VTLVDRLFGADLDARLATGAKVEIDRIFLRPGDVERAEPTLERRQPSRIDRKRALDQQDPAPPPPPPPAGAPAGKAVPARRRPSAARHRAVPRSAAARSIGSRRSAPDPDPAAPPWRAAPRSSASPCPPRLTIRPSREC